ncbi:MAG: site-specific integrase [Planctomycetaceae bacterium]|nr:site-specific integrase [Planctomycetaceae bacterium]
MKIPKLCREKSPSGDLAYVYINRKKIRCGKWGTPEAVEKYNRTIAEWNTTKKLPVRKGTVFTINDLVLEYQKQVDKDFQDRKWEGEDHGSERDCDYALRHITAPCGTLPTNEFGSDTLTHIVDGMVDSGLGRKTINKRLVWIKKAFEWGAPRKMVDEMVCAELTLVKPLKEGKTRAPEYRIILPVLVEYVEKTLEKCHPLLFDMIRVQILGAMRPEDVRLIRLCDINTDDDIWLYKPYTHKKRYQKKPRSIPIIPECQSILMPYVWEKQGHPEDYFFNPADAMKQISLLENPRRFRRNNTGEHERNVCYTTSNYDKEIAWAAKQAGVPHWTPNQLRHLKATDLSEKYGIKVAQEMLGHDSEETTKIYIDPKSLEKEYDNRQREVGRLIAGLPSKKAAG